MVESCCGKFGHELVAFGVPSNISNIYQTHHEIAKYLGTEKNKNIESNIKMPYNSIIP